MTAEHQLDKYTEESVIKEFRLHSDDTQSTDLQIAILCERIHLLVEESKRVPMDRSIRMFLMKLVAKRRRLLAYLRATDTVRYRRLIAKLGLVA